jgi:hypothetical protein
MSRTEQTIDLFARRFEPDGSQYMFRPTIRAPGVPVSASERDRFVGDFCKGLRRSYWIMVGAVVIGIGLVCWLTLASAVPTAWVLTSMWMGLALIAAWFFLAYHRLWNAPIRALRGREPTAPARSGSEARKLALDRLTWPQLGLGVVIVAVTLWRIGASENLLAGWNSLWLVGAGTGLVFIAVQAFRKWRSSGRGHDESC